MSKNLPAPVSKANPEPEIDSEYNRKSSLWYAIFLWLVAFCAIAFASPSDASQELISKGTGTVVYVTDGDTMTINPDQNEDLKALRAAARDAQERYQRQGNLNSIFDPQRETFRTRIGNINTAESVHPDESRNSAAGEKASKVAKKLMTGKRVTFACWEIGYYFRPICSVWTDDFEFGMTMIRNQFSRYVTKYGKHPFWHTQYLESEASAGGQ
ncbi:thermonuclease family protein [Marinobacter subterrani]|uniref:thermonuclease family protein n=1 Tax=Marinobacter subterrani TaxID=1658765 RepID=UPI002354E105|nr:thermonuclease family protein [Marinobacter subterrani]